MKLIVLSCIIMCTIGMSSVQGGWPSHSEYFPSTAEQFLLRTPSTSDSVTLTSPNIATTKKRTQGRVIKRSSLYEDRKILPYQELPYKAQQGLYLEKMPYYETIPHNSFIPHFATTYTGH